MLSSLTYKRKFQLLLLFAALFGVLVYQTALSKTILLYRQNKALDVHLKDAEAAPGRFKQLHAKLKAIDQVVQQSQYDSTQNMHDYLLGILSSYSKQNNIFIKSFPETAFYRQGDFEIQTNIFVLQGDFIKLLQLVYQLEQKQHLRKVSSVQFQSTKDMDAGKTILTATVYLQTVKNTN